jgi:hypothetical protein
MYDMVIRSFAWLSVFWLLASSSNAGVEAASRAISRCEGVYKTRFDNGTVSGEKFESEDILEIVRYSADKIYFRLELVFFNAHRCSVAGIAQYEDGVFTYRRGADGADCVLKIHVNDKDIRFEDVDGECRKYYCGARGGFTSVKFPAKSRRRIRYMKRLLASREYASAKAEHHRATR